MTIAKIIFQPLVALSVTVFLSCNNAETSKEETQKTADTTAVAEAAPPARTTPSDVMQITHTVQDYAAWRPAFDLDSVERKASGIEQMVVGRGIDNPNNVTAFFAVADVQKAKDFSANPRLKEIMGKAGVVSKPEIRYLKLIRFTPDEKIKEWVVVTHKVKDFDTWIKGYDGEGKEKRASEGMQDAALLRGIDDPNLVQIVFDITDLAKAKTAIFSEEKKKLMVNAGVAGKPSIEFYNSAD